MVWIVEHVSLRKRIERLYSEIPALIKQRQSGNHLLRRNIEIRNSGRFALYIPKSRVEFLHHIYYIRRRARPEPIIPESVVCHGKDKAEGIEHIL